MKIEIFCGAPAARCLEEPAFVEQWRVLAESDPKFTLLQEPPFVRSWFRAYDEEHEPVLVTARAPDGALAALMPLALRRRDRRLTHAGAEQAEYHGWLALPGVDEAFLPRAVLELRRVVPFDTWRWRWAPPGAPLGWLADRELRTGGLHAVVERRASPVWDLRDEPKFQKLQDSRSLRSKVNRYKRSGGFRFERIHDLERTRDLMAEVERQCDFRQEVVHGTRPFASDPRKAAFLVGRQAFPGAVHFSVLWNGDRPVAFHLGGCDGRTCLLGLSAYAPSDARHSPGALLLIELARALRAEGYERLDLTPGTDPYKQRFATGEQELARITLHASRAGASRTRATVALRGLLQRTSSAQALAVQERLVRWRRSLRTARDTWQDEGGRGVWRALRRRVSVHGVCASRPRDLRAEAPAAGWEVRRQAWADLTAGGSSGAAARRQLLAQASDRFAAGQVLYSARQAGRARLHGWQTVAGNEEVGRRLVEAGAAAADSPLLHGFTWHGPDPDIEALRACLAGMLQDLPPVSADDAGVVLVCLDGARAAQLEAARKLGFQPIGVLRGGRLAGRARPEAATHGAVS